MVAREQLEFTRKLVARFSRPSNVAAPIDLAQAQYIAIITLLRSIGHVFEKVDCDSPAKKQWSKSMWSEWKKEPIFSEFIDPTRNKLLKEFRGGLSIKSGVFGSPAVTFDAASPDMVGMQGWLNPDEIIDPDGRKVMPQIKEAIEFWDRKLRDADTAFRALPQ
jgi:hypothetical protein